MKYIRYKGACVANSKILSEVYAVIMASGQDYIDLIPEEVMEFITQKKDPYYTPLIDEDKALDEQGFEKETIAMIAVLKLNYWCETEQEKSELLAHLETNEQELQKQLGSSKSARELLRMLKQN